MATKKQPTQYPGVRFREHTTRKHGVKKDRYYFIRYRLHGRAKEEALGWASNGWTAEKAATRLLEIKEAIRIGSSGPVTLAEKRTAAREDRLRLEQETLTLSEFFNKNYLTHPDNVSKASIKREKGLFKKWIEPIMGHKRLIDISTFDCERLKSHMQNNEKAPRTIHYGLALIRCVFH